MATKKEYPEGLPLEPIDLAGNELREGDKVKILAIPDSLLKGLEEKDQDVVKNCEGEVMTITEVDEYGYMWVKKPTLETEDQYESNSFSLEPKHLLKVD